MAAEDKDSSMTAIFPESAQSLSLASRYGYDPWLVGRFLQYIPDIDGFLSKMERPPTKYIRVNTIKTGKKELSGRLKSKGFILAETEIPEVLSVKKSPLPLGATNEYLLGHYYIQDLASCMAVEALDVLPYQAVLDMAAAPGGKTSFIAQRMNNTGMVVALEPNKKRTRSLVFNLSRLGIYNTSICSIDGEKAADLGIKFDRILLDAPCSCEGVIAKDPTRKTNHKPKDIDFCAKKQENLIESAIKVAKPGGLIVYSTCSFAPEENEAIINRALQKFKIELEPINDGNEGLTEFAGIKFDSSLRNTRRFYPHINDTTGFFVARIRVKS